MATTGLSEAAKSLPAAGGTSSAGLASWAAPYVTEYLGQAQALGQMPYQTYQGPLTAGPSALQTKAFEGIGALTVPSQYGSATKIAQQAGTTAGAMGYKPGEFTSTFQAPGAYQGGDFGGVGFTAPTPYTGVGSSFTDQDVAQTYMNPYLEQTLAPQLQALQRQSDIQKNLIGAQAAKAGAFGGVRPDLMNAQLGAELMRQQQQATGQAYTNAFQQAQQQFNTEQQRKIQEAQFAAQQGMTGAELAARYGLEAARAAEQSRQFGAQQGMTGAELGARYGLEAQRAGEQSRQFGAGYGLDALRQQLGAAQTLGSLGQMQQQAGLQNLQQQLTGGEVQRGIEQQGIAADLAEFNAQREFPYKQVQFMRDMISGLPISSVTNTPAQLSGVAQLITALGGVDKLLQQTGQNTLSDLLGGLFGGT